ncbi:hypothetical protein BU24DRAFT_469768 [Aaosphaeria arxii CBS 175.79]|uniref:Uncharacterized protein n=1 Tax=Aaosphaeria arxii CBS 175.79 TaxID=1450172 RepID=A0A6A5Y860_9PLEO|nr:uncharacterized protein BU24DRAFT_469768 [Aaosphaeria arxii CBS 175.79]KAF2021000.1 hypothetical protein BU24DRAFT_469768 [Aaosphaeria arxii CBS 175.79]
MTTTQSNESRVSSAPGNDIVPEQRVLTPPAPSRAPTPETEAEQMDDPGPSSVVPETTAAQQSEILAPSATDVPHPIAGRASTVQAPCPVQTQVTGNVRIHTPIMTRASRMVDELNPQDARLIQEAIQQGRKAGSDVYDSDPEADYKEELKQYNKKNVYRNVRWGDGAYQTNAPDDQWKVTNFTPFVPGRWERMPDGTLRDQKEKCIIRILDQQGKKRIFLNHPPKDWNDHAALAALNKRVVQQIRRHTKIRFRNAALPYAQEERIWISKNLKPNETKPLKGWGRFVAEFNEAFQGKTLGEFPHQPRPARTQSSLSKEVERFAKIYKSGDIPITAKEQENQKAQVATQAARKVV